MGLILLVPGLILYLAGPWFEDQVTVGTILIIVGAVILALQILWSLIVGAKVRKEFKNFGKW